MNEEEHGDHYGGDRWQPVHGTESLTPSVECLVLVPTFSEQPASADRWEERGHEDDDGRGKDDEG